MYKFVLILSVLINAVWLQGQENSLKKAKRIKPPFTIFTRSLSLPCRIKPFSYKHGLQLQMVSLPKDWLETSLNMPFLGYIGHFELPLGFSAEASVHSLIVANQIRVGPRWTYELGRFHVNAGIDVEYDLGWLNIQGFDNTTLQTWQFQPLVTVGTHFDNMAFSAQGRLNYISNYIFNSGDTQYTQSRDINNGFSVGLFMEQRLIKRKVLGLGVVFNYLGFHILGWPSFYNMKTKFFIPQVNITYTL